ncbi:MAG TPA: sugar diacid recognition domain-containing protein, partial [Candidatus Saccharimonadales bacterium]|nr:sugar diacid recognition domain-containing protein [Candidatus Saccharimonadales bacterium]
MQLSRDLAQQIRAKAKAILNREVAVADTSGLILTGPTESGKFAAEALKASQDGRNTTGQMGSYQVEWCPFVYEQRIMGVFGIVMSSSPVAGEAISLLQGLAEVLVHQYFLIDKVQSTEVMRSNFISELLQAPRIDHEAIYRQADILQLSLRSPQAAILVSLDNFEGQLHARTSGLSPEEQRLELIRATEKVVTHLREGFKNYPDNIFAYLGDNTFVILKGIGG